MNTHDRYELPPLPDDDIAQRMTETEVRSLLKRYGEQCARAAIEADRKERHLKDQHKNIKGYRDLSESEIQAMNEGKALAEQVGAWIEKLHADPSLDQRSVDLAKTNLQQGFMWGIRSIAQPTTF